jgi:hypothetical protein
MSTAAGSPQQAGVSQKTDEVRSFVEEQVHRMRNNRRGWNPDGRDVEGVKEYWERKGAEGTEWLIEAVVDPGMRVGFGIVERNAQVLGLPKPSAKKLANKNMEMYVVPEEMVNAVQLVSTEVLRQAVAREMHGDPVLREIHEALSNEAERLMTCVVGQALTAERGGETPLGTAF